MESIPLRLMEHRSNDLFGENSVLMCSTFSDMFGGILGYRVSTCSVLPEIYNSHVCLNFGGSLALVKPSFKLMHAWVMTSRVFCACNYLYMLQSRCWVSSVQSAEMPPDDNRALSFEYILLVLIDNNVSFIDLVTHICPTIFEIENNATSLL